jgi:hypothetical protein
MLIGFHWHSAAGDLFEGTGAALQLERRFADPRGARAVRHVPEENPMYAVKWKVDALPQTG